jgi:hypothetical protein
MTKKQLLYEYVAEDGIYFRVVTRSTLPVMAINNKNFPGEQKMRFNIRYYRKKISKIWQE